MAFLKQSLLGFGAKGLLAEEQVKRVFMYTRETYFQHFRLYNHVLNSRQLSEVKRVFLKIDEPSSVPSLEEALIVGKDRAEVEDEAPGEGAGQEEGEQGAGEDAGGIKLEHSTEELEAKLGKLKIKEEEREMVVRKVKEFQEKMEAALTEKQKEMEAKVEEALKVGGGGKK